MSKRGKPYAEVRFETWRHKKPRKIERRLVLYSQSELRSVCSVLVDILGGDDQSTAAPVSKFDDGLDVTAELLGKRK